MSDTKDTLKAIKFDKTAISLEILDQLLIPYSTVYIPISGINDAFDVIKKMQVRGAPAIAIVGAFSIVVELYQALQKNSSEELKIEQILGRIDYLVTSRPTAVNLSNACRDIKDIVARESKGQVILNNDVFRAVYNYAVSLYEDDLSNNFKIGENGLNYIIDTLRQQNFKGPFSILTVCNTGSLATSGHGTALGIIRTTYNKLNKDAKDDFWLEHIYPCETRPYNQGARLTTYELAYEKLPFTLICDNMVSSLISTTNSKNVKGSSAPVKFIIVGADRIVKNGDTANKIGTYQLSTITSYFNSNESDTSKKIKFIVAAPKTTIDLNTVSGDFIKIEERPLNELTTLTGPLLLENQFGLKGTVGIATPGILVWNPAFDVTPSNLIDCIVTEDKAITKQKDDTFDLLSLF